MKVHPIIFQPEMVRALLAGRKTQTRRLRYPPYKIENGDKPLREAPLARVKVGDVLYVRENWRPDDFAPEDPSRTIYFADAPADGLRETRCIIKWRPSIHLPRNRSRITLAVTEVRFEPVQNISPEDAAAEGLVYADMGDAAGFWFDDEPERAKCHGDGAVECYRELWKRINGEASWEANPEVVAITFVVHQQNVDEFLRAGAANG